MERGKHLNFSGMEIKFLKDGKSKPGLAQHLTGMVEELEEALEPHEENLDRKFPHPAAKWLFTVEPATRKLDETKGSTHRKFAAKLICVMKQGRPDVKPAASFLCTGVKAPDKDDWHKFKRPMCWTKQRVTHTENS